MKQQIIQMVKELVGHKVLYFDDALKVKKSPHTPEVRIWAICVKDDDIFLMDNEEEWYKLEGEDLNYNLVIASLWARMKVIIKKVA